MKLKKIAAILGLAGVLIFIASTVVSVLTFEYGTFSPANCFVTDLGYYAGGYMTVSSAFIFNIGLMISGLVLGVFMIVYGLHSEAPFHTAVSFFGVLSGILMAAQGLFSLNFYTYHYILASSFFVSLFIMCVLYIISQMLPGSRKTYAGVIAAFLTGAATALSAGYMITGSMAEVFMQDASGVGRANVIPFAIIGWVTYVLLLLFIAVLSIRMLAEKELAPKAKPVPAKNGSGKQYKSKKKH